MVQDIWPMVYLKKKIFGWPIVMQKIFMDPCSLCHPIEPYTPGTPEDMILAAIEIVLKGFS